MVALPSKATLRYSVYMSGPIVEIVPCPVDLNLEALAAVLSELTPEQRREIAPFQIGEAVEGLYVALAGGELCGAAWGQRQPGNTAIFWPPKLIAPVSSDTAVRLTCAVAAAVDQVGIRMSQSLLSDRCANIVPTLESTGFTFLADLLYLTWDASRACDASSVDAKYTHELEFEPYDESKRERMVALLEKTYEATQDCAAMNGQRPMDEVLAGYRATGVYLAENWLIVRTGDADIGVLLLAEHRTARHWELMYMGVVPHARGRGFGNRVVQHAQRLAHAARAERVVLAVDAENFPAIKMYNATGFMAWDQRTVFVRFRS